MSSFSITETTKTEIWRLWRYCRVFKPLRMGQIVNRNAFTLGRKCKKKHIFSLMLSLCHHCSHLHLFLFVLNFYPSLVLNENSQIWILFYECQEYGHLALKINVKLMATMINLRKIKKDIFFQILVFEQNNEILNIFIAKIFKIAFTIFGK